MKARPKGYLLRDIVNMASSSKQRNSSHKCCAAALCNNRSDNRQDLIFHNFPLDEKLKKIWDQMNHGDKKFASNSSLFCCSEHFSEKDYRKSLTGKRRDLVKNAVPSIFPCSVGQFQLWNCPFVYVFSIFHG